MQLNDFYAAVGGDHREVLERLPSEELVRRFLRRFPDDPSYAALKAALAADEWENAFRAAHTLKGTAANLGLGALTSAASALTEALRGAHAAPERALVTAVDAAYRESADAIARLDG